jgi:tripartite-type tricarboxylate transporter receptor subunit TctC
MPGPIVERLNTAINKVLAMPAIIQSFKDRGVTVVTATPEGFGRFIQSEVAEWTQVVKDAGVKIE